MNESPITSIECCTAEEFIKLREQATEPPEERLRSCLAFMQGALAQEGSPDFKGFWLVRQFCFPLFKEALSHHTRAQLWETYTDLTREGRRLKGMLDAESSFAAEQIALALSDLEEQVRLVLDEKREGAPSEVTAWPQALRGARDSYTEQQTTLSALNLIATRIHSLRKELIKTPMRMKHKNQLFERLSLLGDRVFPQRKALISDVGTRFLADVEKFVHAHFAPDTFQEEKMRRQVFFFRDEIKAFQTFAKLLTLDTQTFMTTRTLLSQCWDQLKGMEKELKREFAEQKQHSSEHVEVLRGQMREIQERFVAGTLEAEEGIVELNRLLQGMRQFSLVKTDVISLKDFAQEISQPLYQQQQQKLQAQRAVEELAEQERKAKVTAYKQAVESFIQGIAEADVGTLEERLLQLRQELNNCACNKGERQGFEALLKQAKEKVLEKQEQTLLNLPHESRQVLEELTQMLAIRKEQRREIKGVLDAYRKMLAGSSLDLEKAMTTQERVAEEKEALERCDTSIAEIEKKIQDLKHRS